MTCTVAIITILAVSCSLQVVYSQTCGNQLIPNKPGNSLHALNRIIGGQIATAGSWPWQVQLKAYGQHQCGGTIISNNWIVSAAHCFNQYGFTSAWTVHAGSWRMSSTDSTESSYRVARIIRHSYYSPWGGDYDIAVVQLSSPIQFDNYRQPACLPSGSQSVSAGTMCYVTGWGETGSSGGSGYLKQAHVPIVDGNTCRAGHPGQISNNMICAGYTTHNTHRPCYGDSGGPLVCERSGVWYLQGVVSWGDEYCNDASKPGVFSNTVAYANWIQGAINSVG